jgi:A118 family predicted phage portal protein
MAKDLTKLFQEKGYNPVIGTIYRQQAEWLSWYRGNVDGFHNIQKKTIEGRLIALNKPSLQMGKKVCEDNASLLFNENVKITVNSEKAQKVLDDKFEETNYYDEMPNFIELTGTFGTGVSVEYIAENEVKMNYLFGDKVVVIDYENTTIKAIAVIQSFQKDQRKFNHVMYHTHKDGIYRITHEMYGSKNARGLGSADSLGVLFSEAELKEMRHVKKEGEYEVIEYYIEYETDTPHFQVFKYPISNNYDVRSPMGIALFANSIGTLENIDEKYYSSRMDSINSRKRLFVDEDATKMVKQKDANGNLRMVKYFDQDETQFQPLKGMAGQGQKAIETYAPDYDSAQHDLAIQAELNYLSSKCMLGTNYYDYQNGQVGYVNELNTMVSNSDTFRNRNKTLNRLRKVIIAQAKALLFLAKENNEYGGELDLEYSVQFDDDIMTDDQSMLQQYRTDAMDGLIPEYMYIMRAYKVDETEAKAILEEANENGQDYDDIVVEPNIDDEPDDEEQEEE